jgi:hypothetical protein
MGHTHTNGRGDSAARRLVGQAASTHWLISFANGGRSIEWGINKAAIISLMQSRYGFTQWVEFVDGIDPLTPANDPNNATISEVTVPRFGSKHFDWFTA